MGRHFKLDEPWKRAHNLTGRTLEKKRREFFKLLRKHFGAEAQYAQDYLLLGMLDSYNWGFPGYARIDNSLNTERWEHHAKNTGYTDFNDLHKSIGYRHAFYRLLNTMSREHKKVRQDVVRVLASWLVCNDLLKDFLEALESNRKSEKGYWSLNENTQNFYDKVAVNIALSKLEENHGNEN